MIRVSVVQTIYDEKAFSTGDSKEVVRAKQKAFYSVENISSNVIAFSN